VDTLSIGHSSASTSIRFLAIDAATRPIPGHPGLPIAAPHRWPMPSGDKRAQATTGRTRNVSTVDRFVLSAGHGCMLLIPFSTDRYKSVGLERPQAIPAVGLQDAGPPGNLRGTPGVEVTTGRFGQGIANRWAWRSPKPHIGRKFPTGLASICDHFTYVNHGDGCPGGHSPVRPASRPATWAWQADRPLRRQPHHPSMGGHRCVLHPEDVQAPTQRPYGWPRAARGRWQR